MSDAVAPASSAPASPAPQGEAGKPSTPALSIVKADDGAPESPDAAARARKRAGKQRAERKATEKAEAIEKARAPKLSDFTTDKAEAKADDDKQPDAVREGWAAKLKTEHEAATKKAAESEAALKKAQSEWARAYHAAKDEIEDTKADVEHYKGLFDRLVAGLKAQGFDVDPLEMQMAERDRELRRYKARETRGQKQATDAQVKQLAGGIASRVQAMIAKYPELDPKKNPEAAEYIRGRLFSDPKRYPLADLERDLEWFARHQRAALGAKAGAPAPTTSAVAAPPQRPQASTLGDAARAAPPATRGESWEPRSDKQIKSEFQRRKALRLANG